MQQSLSINNHSTRLEDASRIFKSGHVGDLGNIQIIPGSKHFRRSYFLSGINVSDLWGRSLIVHADEDDLGKGLYEDSGTTGHSGARIGCAIFGRGY